MNTIAGIKTTALYVRVSTARQAEEGYSVPAQLEKLTYYCKSQGWDNIKEYVDGGYSGSSLERPNIQKLIQDAEKSKIERVIVFKLDRLSRSQKDTLYLIEDVFLKNNIEFVSLNESLDTSSPYGKLMIGILSGFAQLERENIFLRTRMGMRERLRQGYWRGGGTLPFGYDYDKEKGILVPNEQASMVVTIFDLYLKGYSPQRIAKMYNLSGERLVAKMLTHKIYIGIIENKGEEFNGLHEPLISDEMFELVQLKLKERSTKARASKSKYHLLSGLIYCGKCGSRMRYVSWGKGKYKLGCYAKLDKDREYMHKNGICDAKCLWASEIEKIIINDLFNISVNLKNSDAYKSDIFVDPLQELRTKINQKKAQINKLIDLFTDSSDELDSEIFSNRMIQYKGELASLQKEYEIESATQISKRHMNLIIAQVTNIQDHWNNFTEQEKQSIIRDCIEKIIIDENRIEIKYTFVTSNEKYNEKVA